MTLPEGVHRVHIVGGSGTGKSTLADEIGTARGLPVIHLDDIEFERPTGAPRPAPERDAALEQVLDMPDRVTEGIQTGWTADLFGQADVIVWLDQLSAPVARRRIVRRFLAGALDGARGNTGRARFARFGDYRRELAGLVRAMGETGVYHQADAAGSGASRAATETALAPHLGRTIHCRSAADVERLLTREGGA